MKFCAARYSFALTVLLGACRPCLADTLTTSGWCSPAIADVKGDVVVETVSDALSTDLTPSKPSNLSSVTSSKELRLETKGDNAAAIFHVGGSVHIVCAGVNPLALIEMNRQLESTKESLAERTRAADKWASQYFALKRFVETANLPSDLAAEADGYITTGQFDKAEALFRRVTQAGLQTEAMGRYGSAQVHRLQGRKDLALREFQEAYEADPVLPRYALAYGAALQETGALDKAESVYRKALQAIDGRDERKRSPMEPDSLFLVRAKLVANLCGIDLAQRALDTLQRDLNPENLSGHTNCFEVDHAIMDRIRQIYDLRGGPPSPETSLTRLGLLSDLAQEQISLFGNELVYLRAFQTASAVQVSPGFDPLSAERNVMQDNREMFDRLFYQAVDEVRGRPDARQLVEPFERQRTLAAIDLADAECAPEKRAGYVSDSGRLQRCWFVYADIALGLSALNDSTLISVGPAQVYVHEQVFQLTAELLKRNRVGQFSFADHDGFDRCLSSQGKSLDQARAVYRRLAAASDPEIKARYTEEYSRFLQDAIAALRREGQSRALKDLQKEASRLPKPPRTQSPAGRFNQPRWTPFFSDSLAVPVPQQGFLK